jgi:hypothetical protein
MNIDRKKDWPGVDWILSIAFFNSVPPLSHSSWVSRFHRFRLDNS